MTPDVYVLHSYEEDDIEIFETKEAAYNYVIDKLGFSVFEADELIEDGYSEVGGYMSFKQNIVRR